MNGILRKKIDISFLKKIDTRFGDSALWQFVKFNLVSFSITLLQLALANLLPLIFDGVTAKLPPEFGRSCLKQESGTSITSIYRIVPNPMFFFSNIYAARIMIVSVMLAMTLKSRPV